VVEVGDSLVSREGDFGFSPGNGDPEAGHDVERLHFSADGHVSHQRFAFNCRAADQVAGPTPGTKLCANPADQAFAAEIHGINRPVDGKFGPDGAYYVVDFGAVRDFGRSDPAAKFKVDGNGPLVQIPATGVIWRISKVSDTSQTDGPTPETASFDGTPSAEGAPGGGGGGGGGIPPTLPGGR
jgi:hypothetical protein